MLRSRKCSLLLAIGGIRLINCEDFFYEDRRPSCVDFKCEPYREIRQGPFRYRSTAPPPPY